MNKTALLEALSRFIAKRPGLDPREYCSGPRDIEGFAAYRSDSRAITRDKHDALAMLRYIKLRDSITAEKIVEASKHAFSGRLTIEPIYMQNSGYYGLEPEVVDYSIQYCPGQYFPMEYRRATAAVLASAIYARLRDDAEISQPQPHQLERNIVREAARRELGASIARRFFH